MKHTALIALSLSAIVLTGCSTTETYSRRPGVLEGQAVEVETSLTAERLRTETWAGRYAVSAVALRLADGTVLEPTFSARTAAPSADRDDGGMRVGIGFGVGSGYSRRGGVGTGVGVSAPVGGGDDVGTLTQLETRWSDPPVDRQPFTAVVTLATEPATVVDVPLGYVTDTHDAPTNSGAQRIETWKLPDGTTRDYLVFDDNDEVRYKTVQDDG